MGEVKVDLKGKTALVTGATKGIGRAITNALSENGAKIIAISRSDQDLNLLKKELNISNNCLVKSCDVSNVKQINEVMSELEKEDISVDILVNSAGINIQMNALEVTEESWDKIININLKGAFFMSQGVAKNMIKNKVQGKIINITSQMALVGYYKRVAYCASKGGLTQATKVLAVELAPYNINVNCVAPTFIKTPLTEPMFEDKNFLEDVIDKIPLGRIGETKDVSGAVLYLVSDSSNLVTGSTILVDGGWVAW